VTTVEVAAPPTLGRWTRIVGGLSMNLALGTLYAWSVFVAPLESQFGWKRTETSLAFTIAVVTFAASFIVAGRLQDRFGPFWISMAGALLVSLGFFMCAETHSLAWLYGWFGVVVGLGNGFGYATPIPVMAKWFPDHRGLAVGTAVAGYGGGSALFGPLCSSYLIPTYGLPTTFRVLGLVFLVMTLIGAILLRNPPAGYRPPGWKGPGESGVAAAPARQDGPGVLLRSPSFYLMWVAYALGTSAGLMVINQLKPFASAKGLSEAAASIAFFIGAAGNATGRLGTGWLSDSFGRLNVLRLMIGVSMVAMLVLDSAASTVLGLYALIFVVYACYGAQMSVNATATADFWGTKHAGINYGLLFTAFGVAGVLGPQVGSWLYVRYGDYRAAFFAAAGLAAVALVCELLARRPAERGTD